MKRFLHTAALLLAMLPMSMQAQQTTPQVEVFCGADLKYADVNFVRLYDVLLNLTPGVKYHIGHGWQIAGQVYVPVVNEGFDQRYNMIRLTMANVAKVLRFDEARQYVKLTAGLFDRDRYGLDGRWMFPVNSWLMLHARAGVTSSWGLGFNFGGLHESEFKSDWSVMGIGGASVWLNRWATEFRASGGRYMNEDYGVEGEIARHFKHCSVSIFAQYHELAPNSYRIGTHRYGGGFRVVMMLPPYKKSDKRFVVRPASNFRLTYNAQSDGYSMKRYFTDPEENERTQPIDIPWGTGNFNER